jgi:hypothetical protein
LRHRSGIGISNSSTSPGNKAHSPELNVLPW